MKKWRGLTDDEAQDELEQIAYERQIIEEASFNGGFGGSSDGDDGENPDGAFDSGDAGMGAVGGQQGQSEEGQNQGEAEANQA